MSELTLTLNPKLILKRVEPTQSKFIAVRFNARTGKTLLDRATISESLDETKRLSEARHEHRCVRIVQLETRVVRRFDTPTGATEMVPVEAHEEDEEFA